MNIALSGNFGRNRHRIQFNSYYAFIPHSEPRTTHTCDVQHTAAEHRALNGIIPQPVSDIRHKYEICRRNN